MTEYRRPGVYIEERLLTNVEATTASASALFVGAASNGRTSDPVRIETWGDYVNEFGGIGKVSDSSNANYMTYLPYAVYSYFQNGGRPAYVQRAVSSTDTGVAANLVVPTSQPIPVTNVAWSENTGTVTAPGHPFQVGDRVSLFTDVDGFTFGHTTDTLEVITAVDGDDFSFAMDVDTIPATNEVQTVQVTGTGGTFTLDFDGDVTSDIAYNASASAVSAALRALPRIGTGNVSVSLSGDTYTVTFINALAGSDVVALVADDTNIVDGAVTVLTSTAGESFTHAANGVALGPDRSNPKFTLVSKTVGAWANYVPGSGIGSDKGLAVEISFSEDVQTLPVFNITVYVDGVIVERFRNLTWGAHNVPTGLKNADQAINDLNLGSQFIKLIPGSAFDGEFAPIPTDYPTSVSFSQPGVARSYAGAFGRVLAGLPDEVVGTNPDLPTEADLLAAAQDAVGKIDQPLLVNVPGYIDGAGEYVSTQLNSTSFTSRTDVFVVNDYAPKRSENQTSGVYTSSIKSDPSGLGASFNDSFVASYTPWVVIPDPQSSSGVVTVPPGGAVCGAISRIDTTIGVFRAPAGMVASLSNVIGVDTTFTDSQLAELNTANINVIKPVPGVGIAIMGARTRKQFGVDRYVSGRRTIIFIEESLRRASAFAVFENNSERLWTQLKLSTENFLRNLWEQGGLRGATADEAFFVVCDATINTPAVIASGEVRMDIGVALEYPAEFVVLRLSQYESGGFRAEFINNTV